MERNMVASSNVRSVGYSEPAQTLEVEFLNGSVYQYYNVPEFIYSQLMRSDSKGGFLHREVKNFYPYSRVG